MPSWLLALALLQDPAIATYLERLTQKLSLPVPITVETNLEPRATSQPTGITLTTALIAGAQNEAELAGILAHEIAHYQSRTECLRFTTQAYNNGKQTEHEADQAAIQILTKAGYDPINMLRYFSVIRHNDPKLNVAAFSAEDILIERLQLEATDHPMKNPVVDTPEFQRIRQIVKPPAASHPVP